MVEIRRGVEEDKAAAAAASAKFVIGTSDEDLEDCYQNDPPVATHVVPPDGGFGWVVVAASFLCNVVVDGIIFSTGMLLPSLIEEFKVTSSQAAWVSSLLGGFYLIVGPFVSALANAYGFRLVCILGSVIGAAAFSISYFATNIYFLYITFGILGGTGFGLIYVPAVIATGFYFDKRRALATGIAVCGSGIGSFIFAPLNGFLLKTFDWRTLMLVYAGIILTCAVFGLAFRPLLPVAIPDQPENAAEESRGTPLLLRIKKARDEQLRQCVSVLSIGSAGSQSPSKLTLEETSEPKITVARELLERQGALSQQRYSFPSIMVSPDTIKEEDIETTLMDSPRSLYGQDTFKHKSKILDDNKNETQLKNFLNVNGIVHDTARGQTGCPRNKSAPSLAQPRPNIDHARRPSRLALRTETSRPFYRDDIFYSGSMARLPQYRSSSSVDKYHASVTHLPPMEDIAEEETEMKGTCRCCPASMTHVLSKMFDFSLLKSPTFVVLGIAGFLSLLALFVPFMYLPSYAKQLGSDEGSQATLLAIIGVTNTVGRIVCGAISDHPKVDALMVSNLALTMGGLATCLLPFMTDESFLLAYSMVFGFSVSAFASLRSILLVELLGLEKLTNAFGLLLLFQGVAATFGAPIAGAFYDLTHTYDLSFYVFGSVFAVSGLMCVPLRRLKAWEDRRNTQFTATNSSL